MDVSMMRSKHVSFFCEYTMPKQSLKRQSPVVSLFPSLTHLMERSILLPFHWVIIPSGAVQGQLLHALWQYRDGCTCGTMYTPCLVTTSWKPMRQCMLSYVQSLPLLQATVIWQPTIAIQCNAITSKDWRHTQVVMSLTGVSLRTD